MEEWTPEAVADAEKRLALDDSDLSDSTVRFADFALQVLDSLGVVDPA